MQKKIILLSIALMFFGFGNLQADKNKYILGYEVPEVCRTTNIRCIFKKQGKVKYWCLKSAHQRNLDTKRTTSPIKKTYNEKTGNCAEKIGIYE